MTFNHKTRSNMTNALSDIDSILQSIPKRSLGLPQRIFYLISSLSARWRQAHSRHCLGLPLHGVCPRTQSQSRINQLFFLSSTTTPRQPDPECKYGVIVVTVCWTGIQHQRPRFRQRSPDNIPCMRVS